MANWVWGNYQVQQKKGKVIYVFKNGGKGGFACVECNSHFGKKVDVIKKHITRTHGGKKELMENVPVIKEECEKCSLPLDPHPNKMERHMQVHNKNEPKSDKELESDNLNVSHPVEEQGREEDSSDQAKESLEDDIKY